MDCPDGKKITYNYDSSGNLEKLTDSNGNEVVYGYDEELSLISRVDVWEGLHYDNWGRVVKKTGAASNYVAYKYCENHYSVSDALGNVVSFKYSDYSASQMN